MNDSTTKIWIHKPIAGFAVAWTPEMRNLPMAPSESCSRWKPTRVTISGEAWNMVAEAAALHNMTVRQMLEAMIHHGLSGIYRPGSWEAVSPFHPYMYHGNDGQFADRWFQ